MRAAYVPDHPGLEALDTIVPGAVFIGLGIGGILRIFAEDAC